MNYFLNRSRALFPGKILGLNLMTMFYLIFSVKLYMIYSINVIHCVIYVPRLSNKENSILMNIVKVLLRKNVGFKNYSIGDL